VVNNAGITDLLITADVQEETIDYTYGDPDNDPNPPEEVRIDNRLMETTNGSEVDYGYDEAGNTTSENVTFGAARTFEYNYHLRLKRVIEDQTTLGEYTYDALGRRVKKVAGGVTTFYIYDQRGFLIEEADSQGTWQKDYVYVNGQPLAMIEKSNRVRSTHLIK